MARMTAVAMLLPRLVVALLLGAAVVAIAAVSTIKPLRRDAWQAIIVEDPLLPVLYLIIATLLTLLWGMGVTHTQVRAWVHQQGLAVTAGLMKLKSATKCLLPRGFFSLLHSPIEAAEPVMARMAGTHELKKAIEVGMRVLGVQLEETRRELEDTRRVLDESKRELAAVKGEVAQQNDAIMKLTVDLQISQSEGDQKKAWKPPYHASPIQSSFSPPHILIIHILLFRSLVNGVGLIVAAKGPSHPPSLCFPAEEALASVAMHIGKTAPMDSLFSRLCTARAPPHLASCSPVRHHILLPAHRSPLPTVTLFTREQALPISRVIADGPPNTATFLIHQKLQLQHMPTNRTSTGSIAPSATNSPSFPYHLHHNRKMCDRPIPPSAPHPPSFAVYLYISLLSLYYPLPRLPKPPSYEVADGGSRGAVFTTIAFQESLLLPPLLPLHPPSPPRPHLLFPCPRHIRPQVLSQTLAMMAWHGGR
ncbi:unnamed protein product [Closterium sp. NIES-64]|nr:unnamed protein product [Closterium sp. NIES-64]